MRFLGLVAACLALFAGIGKARPAPLHRPDLRSVEAIVTPQFYGGTWSLVAHSIGMTGMRKPPLLMNFELHSDTRFLGHLQAMYTTEAGNVTFFPNRIVPETARLFKKRRTHMTDSDLRAQCGIILAHEFLHAIDDHRGVPLECGHQSILNQRSEFKRVIIAIASREHAEHWPLLYAAQIGYLVRAAARERAADPRCGHLP
ncbi:MAG: hypothetical protein KGI60_01705 [Patescibacteria group bacterium]|nr:hypothetical protein [Patescibacteria group bacterium]